MATFQVIPQKYYEYRVSDTNFIGIWQDVSSEFGYDQAINQNASELEVEIARAPDNLIVKLDPLMDHTGAIITDENSTTIFVQTETANAVGEDTDIDLDYNVDVYAFYGGYDELLDHNGNTIYDHNSDPILSQFGNPNGKRVYSGYIADYELLYGRKTGVRVVIVPHPTEMDHYVYKSGTSTTVTHNSTDPVAMARAAMDNYISQGGVITYDTSSMPLSGQTNSYTFKLQTTREVLDKSVDLLPAGYYHFVHPGENKAYLLQKGSAADHIFWYEKHITELKLRKSITQLKNDIYFTGGNTGGGIDLFVQTRDATSVANWRPGLERKSDSRVTQAASAELLNQQDIDQYGVPRYRTSVTITDAVYDIESIELGEMVGFRNFETFVDSLILQIVKVNRNSHKITLDLDMIVPSDTKRLYELKKELMAEQIRGIPSVPS